MRWFILAWLLVVSRVAAAHQTSVKYVDITLDGASADVLVRVAPGDVTEPMHLPADARPSADEAAAAPEVAAFVQGWIALASYGEPCKATPPAAHAEDGGKLVAIAWRATCVRAPDHASFTSFFSLDKKHVAIVHVTGEGIDSSSYVGVADPELALREAPTLLVWLAGGIHHIVDWDGRDHISFVLALLLVVMLVRDDRGTWQIRALVPTLRSTATVVTAFTIAHSLSLISAALGWIHLPSRLVESLIALSIAYTAGENIVRPDVRWRYWLTFGFGLVHGLGFASTLAVQLPPHSVVVPLLCFNVGVELGQLTIVLIALPAFYALARKLGAARYRNRVMPAISAVILAAGLVWVLQRTLLT